MKRRFSAEERQGYTTEFQASGETVDAFAKRCGISPKTLYTWVGPRSRKASKGQRKPKFARLWPTEAPMRKQTGTLRIAIGGGLIEVGEGFNPALLRAVVAALGVKDES